MVRENVFFMRPSFLNFGLFVKLPQSERSLFLSRTRPPISFLGRLSEPSVACESPSGSLFRGALFPRLSVSLYSKKLPRIRLGLQKNPSVQRLIPLSSSSNTKTEPDVIILRSESTSRRVTLGISPLRAASRMRRASPVVSIQPHQGGSVQVWDGCWLLPC